MKSSNRESVLEEVRYYAGRWPVILHDSVMVVIAWFLAYWFRFNLDTIPQPFLDQSIAMLPLVVLIHIAMSIGFSVPRGAWRFTSTPDISAIVKSVFFGTAVIAIAMFFATRLEAIPRSVFPLQAVLLIGMLITNRLLYRAYHTRSSPGEPGMRVLVIGAGVAGDMLVRDLRNSNPVLYEPVGFLDDDPDKKGRHIQGLRVLGACSLLSKVAQELRIELVLIAIPSVGTQDMRRIVECCEEAQLTYRTLPKVQEILDGTARGRDLRPVALDDLLGREPASLDIALISSGLTDKRVLISGAGGSIGSELCRQVVQLNPAALILLEQNEYNLYRIAHEIENKHPDIALHAQLGDVCDETGVRSAFNQYSPNVVFHAAAYKHVPSLESQIRAAVRNNVIGTEVMARVSGESGCEKFVLISTDKAVNPTSVMGATKRMAEILIQARNALSDVAFITVRFGNVLGSAGSVVPLFERQIAEGGPVTVTHPDVTRFFMTISEACQLIMQACVQGQGSETFVLDMGEPIKISYLAKQLIRMAGLIPGQEVEIVYTGLREGEKLVEELFHQEEKLEKTRHNQISLAESRAMNSDSVVNAVGLLKASVQQADTDGIERILKEMVPEYMRQDLVDGSDSAQVISFSR